MPESMGTFLPTLVLSMLASAAPCPPAEPVQAIVLVILGTSKNKDVHERLREIAPELRKKDPTLTGFDLSKTINLPNMRMGESREVDLHGKSKAIITIGEKTDDEGRIVLTVKPPKLDEIQYACTCGKYFPIFTNYYTPDKQRLIIAIMAKPCKKK